jgi:hypothetical protein
MAICGCSCCLNSGLFLEDGWWITLNRLFGVLPKNQKNPKHNKKNPLLPDTDYTLASPDPMQLK